MQVIISARGMTVSRSYKDELTRKLAEANVNVDLAYTTFTGGKIVIATDDVESARAVLP